MIRVLVTGMSGTGKSSVLAELGRRGHRVIDTDHPGWADEVPAAGGPGLEQLWREDRMTAALAGDGAGWLFVSGCVSNQGKFYDRFDAVVLLSLPARTMLDRLAARVSNPFGKVPAERERILRDLRTVEPLLRTTATLEIRTDQPLRDVADAVEAVARRAASSPPDR